MMGALRQRLDWSEDGALHDGPRRYLMMRTDVLMGSLLRLSPQARCDWLQAWAASTQEHGGGSLQAYAAMSGADAATLVDSTVQAAADLGWGRWHIEPLDDGLRLQVHGSPFVQGWRAAQAASPPAAAAALPLVSPLNSPLNSPLSSSQCAAPCTALCAPISGLYTALAGMLLQGPVEVTETACAAMHELPHDVCTFMARRVKP